MMMRLRQYSFMVASVRGVWSAAAPRKCGGPVIVSPADGQVFRGGASAVSIKLASHFAQVCVIVALEGREAEATEACLSETSRIDLANLPPGRHDATAQMLNLDFPRPSSSSEFVPTEHWRPVLEGVSLPAGLEIRLPLDGSHERVARIPNPWRLQRYAEPPAGRSPGFWRTDVHMDTTVADLEASLQAWANDDQHHHHQQKGASSDDRWGLIPRLSYGPSLAPLHKQATARDIDIFSHSHMLHITWIDPHDTRQRPEHEEEEEPC